MATLRSLIVLLTATAVLGTPLVEHIEYSIVEKNHLDFETDDVVQDGYPDDPAWKEYRETLENEGGGRKYVSILLKNHVSNDIVEPNVIQQPKHIFEREDLSYVEDVQKKIEEENPPSEENDDQLQDKRGYRMTWKKYHRLNDIYEYLDYLAKTFPDFVSVKSIGKSYEGNDLKLIKISNGQPKNKAIFIDGGIHAREWTSPATVTYFINQIAENFTNESEDFRSIDWYFLPVLNPDGYEFTHTSNKSEIRFWRKNRKPSSSSCIGTDLNRNFGYKWGGLGTSENPCEEDYLGENAFSEPESKATSDFIKSNNANFSAYLTYHCCARMILYPWGYDEVLPPDYKDLHAAGTKMAEAMQQTEYVVGSSAKVLYPAAGGSDDWAKFMGIKYSYTIELPGPGFDPPASYILPVAKESLAGLRAFVSKMLSE